jgi:ectoine hydroxylase-related dioxygenase (phytanoyl-CoA dioxygenase family)
MISANRDFFAENGFLKLSAFHSRAQLAAIKTSVLNQLKSSFNGGGASRSFRKLPMFQQITRMSSRVIVRGAREALLTSELLEIVSEVAGRQPSAIQQMQFLLSPPNQGAWTLKGLNWHVDVKAEALEHTPGVQAFFLIDDVTPHGGATLALAGSHKLWQGGLGSQARLREALKSHVNLEDTLRDFGLKVLEMSGQAGDVYLMDMRTLHTPAINDSNKLRMMATCRCLMDWQSG